MVLGAEVIITVVSALVALLLLVFAVDWRYFRDWIVIFLYKSLLDSIWGAAVVNLGHLEYPVRLFPQLYVTSVLFE